MKPERSPYTQTKASVQQTSPAKKKKQKQNKPPKVAASGVQGQEQA